MACHSSKGQTKGHGIYLGGRLVYGKEGTPPGICVGRPAPSGGSECSRGSWFGKEGPWPLNTSSSSLYICTHIVGVRFYSGHCDCWWLIVKTWASTESFSKRSIIDSLRIWHRLIDRLTVDLRSAEGSVHFRRHQEVETLWELPGIASRSERKTARICRTGTRILDELWPPSFFRL